MRSAARNSGYAILFSDLNALVLRGDGKVSARVQHVPKVAGALLVTGRLDLHIPELSWPIFGQHNRKLGNCGYQ
jgi:hypothetical protein